ncbi:MAG: WG repeat-containing protein [Clostridiales bacterium]|nr:WG repeat-containing protein [Clostridiales bacterium]
MKHKLFILALILCIPLILTAVTGCAKEYTNNQPLPTSFNERLAAIAPYTPPAPPQRYYSGAVGDFIPSNDYGRVYPYIGQVQEAKENSEGYWFPDSCLYGFVDERGRIICDPVYSSVKLLTFEDKAAYVVRKTSFTQGVTTNYLDYKNDSDSTDYFAWGEDIRQKQVEYYAIVSLDGSFFGQYDNVHYVDGWHYNYYADAKSAEYEYLAVCKEDLWGVIDYNGAEILPCQYYNAPLFSEGLAAVYLYDPDDRDHYAETYTYVYIDYTGKQVLGPFKGDYMYWRLAFSQGRAYNLDGNYYGFIDASGNIVVPHIYANIRLAQGYDKNGLAFVIMMDREKDQHGESFNESTARYGLIDVNGKYLKLRT